MDVIEPIDDKFKFPPLDKMLKRIQNRTAIPEQILNGDNNGQRRKRDR